MVYGANTGYLAELEHNQMNIEYDFAAIYATYGPKVYRLCLGYAAGNMEMAKEWQQQTFIKVWQYRNTYRGTADVGTWIYRIAVNICLGDLRKVKKHREIAEVSLANNIADTETKEQHDRIAKMYHCIDQLNDKNKALILMELEEIPQVTIAEAVGIAHGAIRTRLSRIRKILLKCITDEK